ncbi:hypothetical protein Gotur_029715 [Gossypium turneri]
MADVEENFADLSLEDDEEVVVQLASERLDLGASFENWVLLEYDVKVVSLGYKGIMRVRVRFDIQKLLKRKKKIVLPNGTQTYVSFACEKLTLFCFVCGILGHGESFCPDRILQEKQDFILGWDISLRAPTRHKYVLHDNGSRWYWHDFASFQFPFYLNQLSIHNSDYVDKPSKWIPYRRGSFALYHFALANCSSCS